MKEITSIEEFDKIIINGNINVIKFYTNWCPDCTRMDLFIGEILEAHHDKNWFSINKDEFPQLAEKYNVMGIPSLLIFQNEKKIGHLHSANAKTPEQVEQFLLEYRI